MGVFLIGLGILFIISSLTVIFTNFLNGLACIVCGVGLIIWGNKKLPPSNMSKKFNKKESNSNYISPETERRMRQFEFLENKKKETRDKVTSIPLHQIKLNASNKLEKNLLKDMPEMKFKTITKSFNISTLPAYAVFDVETTGLRASRDKIIEISAIIFEENVPTAAFTTRINPGISISEEASAVNGISDDDVADAPSLDEISESFLEFIGNLPLVAYNAAFDLKFLYVAGIDLISAKNKIYDAYAIAQKAYKDSYDYKLTTIANDQCNLYFDAHNSLYDCYATAIVFQDCIEEICF